MVAIGIDLGTTNCCIATYKNNKIEIIPNPNGKTTTPSTLSFFNNQILVGESAIRKIPINPQSTVYGLKYLIGRSYNDVVVSNFRNKNSIQVHNSNEKLKVAICGLDGVKDYHPEELCGIILQQLKFDAERALDASIESAVITVPTYFNDAQRQATLDAGKIAGFKNVSLFNEATSAAIVYGEEFCKDQNPKKVLVYDFGGGTFDVSVVSIKDRNYEVLAIDGDLELGGDKIDQLVFEYLVRLAKIKFNIDVKEPKHIMRLKGVARRVKVHLSEEESTLEEIDFLEKDILLSITRDEFEKVTAPVFNETIRIVRRCLDKIDLKTTEIDAVVLVGGSSRNICVSNKLKNLFGVDPKMSINPDEAVARGAAIKAAKLYGGHFEQVSITTLNPYSLGVRTSGDKMSVIIPKHSKLPFSSSKLYRTVSEDQDIIVVKVYSGESDDTEKNELLGKFHISGMRRIENKAIVEEVFSLDEDGILNVTAKSGDEMLNHLSVNVYKGRLTEKEINSIREKLENL